jgi:hypothetical protein
MMLTAIPSSASSNARVRVSDSIAPFAEVYPVMPGIPV